jgi:hypothetical protein
MFDPDHHSINKKLELLTIYPLLAELILGILFFGLLAGSIISI